ncbi:MAG: GAP family protein [Acidimicrobiia bacterium]
MGNAIGQVLPLAVGVALSPIPIAAVILMLFTPRARTTAASFALGWLLGLGIAATVVLVISGTGDAVTADSGGPSTTIGWVKLALGVILLLLAARRWRNRPRGDESPDTPAWMDTLDHVGPGRSLVLGAALSGINPKNLALTIAAATTIASVGLSTGEEIGTTVVFVLLASVTVLLPVVAFLVSGDRATATLDRAKTWLIRNNGTVIAVVFLVFGAKLIGDGISILS